MTDPCSSAVTLTSLVAEAASKSATSLIAEVALSQRPRSAAAEMARFSAPTIAAAAEMARFSAPTITTAAEMARFSAPTITTEELTPINSLELRVPKFLPIPTMDDLAREVAREVVALLQNDAASEDEEPEAPLYGADGVKRKPGF